MGMTKRKKSALIVLCWVLMMTAGNLIYIFIPNRDDFAFMVYAITLIRLGEKLELWMEQLLHY